MGKPLKISLILGGYALAFAGASLAVYIHDLLDNGQTSPGMAAGGDIIYFIGLFAFLSLFPTALGLFFLRPYKKLWILISYGALAWALTGPLAEVLNTLARTQQPQQGWLVLLSFIALLRVFGVPLCAFGFLGFILLAPDKKARGALLIATLIEGALSLYLLIHFIFWQNFA